MSVAISFGEGAACHAMGRRYRDRVDVAANPFLAAEWFRRGCDKIYAESCLAAAELYSGVSRRRPSYFVPTRSPPRDLHPPVTTILSIQSPQ